jgi:hypothetical protein
LTYAQGDDTIYFTEALPEGRASVFGYLRRFFLERRFLFCFFLPSRKTMSEITNPAMLHSFSRMSNHFIISPLFTSFLILLYQTYLLTSIDFIKNFSSFVKNKRHQAFLIRLNAAFLICSF